MPKERITFRAEQNLVAAIDALVGTCGSDRSDVITRFLSDGIMKAVGQKADSATPERLEAIESILTDIQSRLTKLEPADAKILSEVNPPKPIEIGTVMLTGDAAISSGYPGRRGGLSPWCKVRGFNSSAEWLMQHGWESAGGYRWCYIGKQ